MHLTYRTRAGTRLPAPLIYTNTLHTPKTSRNPKRLKNQRPTNPTENEHGGKLGQERLVIACVLTASRN